MFLACLLTASCWDRIQARGFPKLSRRSLLGRTPRPGSIFRSKWPIPFHEPIDQSGTPGKLTSHNSERKLRRSKPLSGGFAFNRVTFERIRNYYAQTKIEPVKIDYSLSYHKSTDLQTGIKSPINQQTIGKTCQKSEIQDFRTPEGIRNDSAQTRIEPVKIDY
ncbi:hypothetical protein GE061_007644 [Apolygus lucorum]|uniref:Uncharacterized protein n=1 Tax=Apolygus lucorum TaxID=248454 RepID=A0A8S9WLX1_APOLU|nr:hypothetical protein GE061_007644 [Apolygus lucorum]